MTQSVSAARALGFPGAPDEQPVIIAATRTPIGRHAGSLSGVRPDDLAALAIRSVLDRTEIEASSVDEVFLGCANQAGEDNRNVARMALLLAGMPDSVPGVTVNRLCASGLTAVNQAARAILAGEAEIVIAGGVESMSRAPYVLPKNPRPFGPSGNVTAYDSSLGWRFPNPAMQELFPLEAMGVTAENIVEAADAGQIPGGPITRAQQDEFALESHRRAMAAMSSGRFAEEITPVPITDRRTTREVSLDEHPRVRYSADGQAELDTSLEQLAKLKPLFRDGGSVTAGNASGMNDGAAALVMTSARTARRLGLEPMAIWRGSTAVGVDPRLMGLGPVPATRKLLERFGLGVDDVELVEVNEAFAAQVIAVSRMLGLDAGRTNVNGGAVALGHPLGASGARLLTTLVYELERRGGGFGLATLCVGVGQGEATLVEGI